jgi:hypothetical protein
MSDLDVKVIRGTAQNFILPATPYQPAQSTRKLMLWWGLYTLVLAGAWIFGTTTAPTPHAATNKAALQQPSPERPKPVQPEARPKAEIPAKPQPQEPPVVAPTATPVAIPTAPPVAVPTAPPVAIPTAPPVAIPTAPPVAIPTAPPVAIPTAPPTVAQEPSRIEIPMPPAAVPQPPPVLRAGKGAVKVKTTSTLILTTQGTKTEIALAGIKGSGGATAREFQDFIDLYAPVECEGGGPWTCSVTIDGQQVDLAAAALRNGAARTTDDAPDAYRRHEAQAKAEHKGIWKK